MPTGSSNSYPAKRLHQAILNPNTARRARTSSQARGSQSATPIITGRPAFISFQTVAELLYGALRRGWGTTRILKLEAKIQRVGVVHTGPELVHICAQLRADCEAAGHALGQRGHNADRWIAATAIRVGVPLVSNDAIFRGVPGLTLRIRALIRNQAKLA